MLRAFARHARSRSTPAGSRTRTTSFGRSGLDPPGRGHCYGEDSSRPPCEESNLVNRFRRPVPASGRSGRSDAGAPPGTRTRIGSLRRRVLVHRASGAESREGIKPSRAVLQTALLSENRLEHESGQGNRTHIGSLEDCGPTVERCPQITVPQAVESARIELASPGCKPGTLPLSYDPEAGREGIEPSLRVLEARWSP